MEQVGEWSGRLQEGVLMHGLVGFVDLFRAIPTLAIHPLGREKITPLSLRPTQREPRKATELNVQL